MNLEIEYRYLIDNEFFKKIKNEIDPFIIKQAYLIDQKEFQIRVRIEHLLSTPNEKIATLTTKTGKKPARNEYEEKIAIDHAEVLYEKAYSVLEKMRYKLNYNNLIWEIDYYPAHKLAIAEVEVPSLNYNLDLPHWVTEEVTLNSKYSNTSLAKKIK